MKMAEDVIKNGAFDMTLEHCDGTPRLAKRKKFMEMKLVGRADGNIDIDSIMETPLCGPPALTYLKTDKRDGWVVYRWRAGVGGLQLYLYNPQTNKKCCRMITAHSLTEKQIKLRFFVPKRNMSLWGWIKSAFDKTLRYECYIVEMLIRPARRFDVIVYRLHAGGSTTYQFMNLIEEGESINQKTVKFCNVLGF